MEKFVASFERPSFRHGFALKFIQLIGRIDLIQPLLWVVDGDAECPVKLLAQIDDAF